MSTGWKYATAALIVYVVGLSVLAGFGDKAATVTGWLVLTAVFLGISVVAYVRMRRQRRSSGK